MSDTSTSPTSTTPETIRILGWNVQHGRHRDSAIAFIQSLDPAPEIILWQEAQPGDPKKGIPSDAEVVSEALGMDVYENVLTPHMRRPKHNLILIKRDGVFVHDGTYQHPGAPHQAPANVAVRLRLPDGTLSYRRLLLLSGHACYYSAPIREMEADFVLSVFKDRELGYAEFDCNSYRKDRHPRDLQSVRDRTFATNRSRLTADGEFVPDDFFDRRLVNAGLVDVGLWAAQKLGQEGADGPTAGWGPDKRDQRAEPLDGDDSDQEQASAIDRGYTVQELAPVLVSAGPIDDEQTRACSDHFPVDSLWRYSGLVEVMDRRVDVIAH
ncbi:hypothetical protein P3T36_004582 [Kitasatospora sp. MAP12-15]|uniref:hypothetical protein n=1 Tax=unclassified Kitasatospora TaxID=2633591 RepID=UPI00247440D3|nr:hypothetical protein [Kitasatospora sp. MAP12-44]MDH6111428.1 hypothetical protein [Kitasatospora sp. MAP12-44]